MTEPTHHHLSTFNPNLWFQNSKTQEKPIYIYIVGHNLVPLVETIKIVRGKKDVHPQPTW